MASTSTQPRRIGVIGGGIIGTCTAFWLGRLASATTTASGGRGLPVQVTLIEGSEIAAGASGKAGGLVALDWHGPATASLAKLSYNLHAQLAKQLDGENKWGYRKLDTLSISADLSSASASAKKTARTRKLNDSDLFDWLNKDLLTATDVLGSQETTAQVHPEQFTRAIAEQAQKEGLQIVYGTAEHLERTNDGAYAVTISPRKDNDDHSPRVFEFDQIVIAAGPWTGRLLSSLGLGGGGEDNNQEGNIRARAGRAKAIRGSRAHSIVVRAPDGKTLPAQALFTSIKEQKGRHAEPEIYNRPDGTAYACGPTDDSDLPLRASDVAISPSAIASLVSQTARLAPDYLDSTGGGGAKVEREQACYLPVGSGDPVLGRIEGTEGTGKGIYVASGHSCWGIVRPGTGLVMAELLLNGKATSADISSLGP
ncbi:FAD dependent oxidoreductase [Rhodotorula sp. JG-1b]|nr:FAD dependent oxidoreductase [Rhodotorula sp. JG-1b]